MMKRKLCIAVLLLSFILTAGGCGSGSNFDGGGHDKSASESSSEANYELFDPTQAAGGIADSSNTAQSGGSSDSSKDGNAEEVPDTASSSTINTEMLVYTCNLLIDTLDYDQSVATFKSMLANAGGFIESENYSDGNSSSPYYIEENEKDKVYRATVRVPHDKYDSFVNGADQLGDVRSKTSNVENVGQEYSDLNTSLKIYEAKEKRYIKMLASITDDEQAVLVEKELTELQVKIATIKTRMNEIKTDVDYSTVDIQIHEVTKYNEKPQKTDTFFQRLGNTLTDTWKGFLNFLEAVLFLFIRLAPYLLILAVILFCIWQITKKRRERQKEETSVFPKQNDDDHTD